MAIIGFNLNKINIEKKDPIKGQINVKTNVKFTKIEEQKEVDISKDKSVLSFDFTFTIKYEPNVADITFAGHVLSLESPEDAKNILEEWKDKKINENLRLKVTNAIWTKCNVKSFQLEEELGLPIHIPLPRLTK